MSSIKNKTYSDGKHGADAASKLRHACRDAEGDEFGSGIIEIEMPEGYARGVGKEHVFPLGGKLVLDKCNVNTHDKNKMIFMIRFRAKELINIGTRVLEREEKGRVIKLLG